MSKPEETKTPPSSAKAEPKTEAKHDKFNPFAPFFDLTKSFPMPFGADAFAPWIRDHASKLETISEEIAVFERAMMERIKTNAADMAALVQDTLDYLQQVSGEWRKIAIDTARRAADFTGKA